MHGHHLPLVGETVVSEGIRQLLEEVADAVKQEQDAKSELPDVEPVIVSSLFGTEVVDWDAMPRLTTQQKALLLQQWLGEGKIKLPEMRISNDLPF